MIPLQYSGVKISNDYNDTSDYGEHWTKCKVSLTRGTIGN